MIERPIAWCDQDDGDPDLEETGLEDSFMKHHVDGPGCAIADAGEPVGDESDGNFPEDKDAASHKRWGNGPGCHVSDPDKGGEEDGEHEEGY